MIRSGWKRGFVAVLIGIVLGLGGLAGQPAAQAAPASGVSSEGGYYERRPCGDCYDRERACDNRSRRCDCYDRQWRCEDCYGDKRRACDPCEDKTSKSRSDDRCADGGKSCERRGEQAQDDDDDDGSKEEKKEEKKEEEKKERSALHKILRGVFD